MKLSMINSVVAVMLVSLMTGCLQLPQRDHDNGRRPWEVQQDAPAAPAPVEAPAA